MPEAWRAEFAEMVARLPEREGAMRAWALLDGGGILLIGVRFLWRPVDKSVCFAAV